MVEGPALSDGNTWRHPKERAELVERLVASERANRLLEQELRHRVRAEEAHLAGNPEVAALMARVRELEGIIARQNELLQRRTA